MQDLRDKCSREKEQDRGQSVGRCLLSLRERKAGEAGVWEGS